MKRVLFYLNPWALCLVLPLIIGTNARADVIVSTGYNDGTGSGGSPIPPSPWIGSANTTFYGNASDVSVAHAGDPDMSAVLVHNTGTNPVSISDVKLSSEDLFTRAGLSSPVTLNPGQYAIFAAGDGSDFPLSGQTVTFTVNGQTFSAADAMTATAPFGVLFGNSPWINGVETVAWTPIADVLKPSGSAVPEPSSLLPFGFAAFLGLCFLGWRHRIQIALS